MARKREPFDTWREVLIETGSKKSGGHRRVKLGGPPKKLTKGLRRQLRKYHHENINEFHRQCAIVGCTESDALNRRSSKK